jgi:hypothetical protein
MAEDAQLKKDDATPADAATAAPAGARPSAPRDASPVAGVAPAAGESGAAQPSATSNAADTPAPSPAPAKAPAPQPAPSPPQEPKPLDEFDPRGWDVPLICKDCEKPFAVPFRIFHAGVVFHCPSCQGSWVPNTSIARTVRGAFQEFWNGRKAALDAFEQGNLKLDRDEFDRKQAEELERFKQRLNRMAAEYRPAGKLVRRKGLAAMFT